MKYEVGQIYTTSQYPLFEFQKIIIIKGDYYYKDLYSRKNKVFTSELRAFRIPIEKLEKERRLSKLEIKFYGLF